MFTQEIYIRLGESLTNIPELFNRLAESVDGVAEHTVERTKASGTVTRNEMSIEIAVSPTSVKLRVPEEATPKVPYENLIRELSKAASSYVRQ